MKITLLSGAYKNAGDFLIEKRSIELLNFVYPDIHINKILRNQIKDNLDAINSSDMAIFGGGPIYQPNLENYLPIDILLNHITKPIMILGCGWYGFMDGSDLVYRYKFSPKTLEFFRKVDKNGLGLSCRDINSVKTLRKEGLKNVFMTGCPAWYDINRINDFKLKPIEKYNKIAISDPARPVNFDNAFKLVQFIKDKFNKTHIVFIFHRRQDNPNNEVLRNKFNEKLLALGIEVKDISMGTDGFSIYDDCDLHIGFRVHAHIYNLSQCNRTILIEEDGRGAGVNQALGLPQIKAYNDSFQYNNRYLRRIFKLFASLTNNHLVEDVENHINIMETTNWQYIENALSLQKSYFKNMVQFIKRLSN